MKKSNVCHHVQWAALFLVIQVLITASFQSSVFAEDLTADQVIDKVDNRFDGNTSESLMTMVLVDKGNNQRVRQLKGFSKDYGKDSKRIIFFLDPADIRNTSYLVYDWNSEDKDDDSWLYLPALRKVKRVNSNDTSGAFMGSDFSYMDINGLRYQEWDYVFIDKNYIVDGFDTWLIEGTPRKAIRKDVVKKSGYEKFRLAVRKDIFVVVEGKYWVEKDKSVKFFKAKDIREIDSIHTAHELIMVSTKRNKMVHSSIIKYTDIRYNMDIDDSLFTTRKMERGL